MTTPLPSTTLVAAPVENQTVTLAADSNIRAGYDASIGQFFAGGVGHSIGVFMAIVALLLLVGLIGALLAKGRGSQSEFVQRTTGSGKTIAAVCGTIVLLVTFQILMPPIASFADVVVQSLRPILEGLLHR